MLTKPDPALAEYASKIERLKPVIGQPDFNQVLEAIAHDVPKPKRFLIKMELNRLAAPCTRLIDLRGHVDGDVREFDHDGKTHHLDDVAIRIFKRALKLYGGYTIGCYEEIMNADNNFRVLHQRQTKQMLDQKKAVKDPEAPSSEGAIKVNYPAKAIIFGDRGFRSEERMIYAMAVDIELPLAGMVHAVTTDLSVSGCKIKLPSSYSVTVGQKIKVAYTGLEEEFSLGLSDLVEYEVVGIDEKAGHEYPRCKRTHNVELKSFDDFLQRFINGNKRRYKINLDNTIEAVVTKGYEQFYLPRSTSLPIYLKKLENGALKPSYMLTNDNNKEVVRHWLDENNQVCLSSLLTQKRLKHLLAKPGRVKETLAFSFTHVAKGHVYFYSATIDELNKNADVKKQFLAFGASKNNWSVYKVQLIDCHHQLAHIPLTMPNSGDNNKNGKNNNQMPPRLADGIKDVNYIITLTDLNTEISKPQYAQMGLDMGKVNLLKEFGHSKAKPPLPIEEIPIKFVNLRSETRFVYRTEVEVSADLFNENAVTKDFSTKGMQLEFESSVDVEKEEIVQLAMPSMQKITKRYKLKDMPYEVVGFNESKTIVNVRVFEEKGSTHIGKVFLSELIEKNREKLKAAAESNNSLPGLAEALRNIYIQRVTNTAMYIHKDGIKHDIHTLGFAPVPNALVDTIQNDNEAHDYNLFPFLNNNYLNELFIATLRKMQRHNRPAYKDLYIKFRPAEIELTNRFEVKLTDEFRNPAAEKIFLQKSTQAKSTLFALRLFISRTGRPDTDFISKELAYVSQYAIHKAKVLENELWSVAGVVDIIDITEEVLNRFMFPAKTIEQQLAKRQP